MTLRTANGSYRRKAAYIASHIANRNGLTHDDAITALRQAHAALSSIASLTCFSDDLPVTALESREIEDIFIIASAHLDHIKAILAQLPGGPS